MSSFAFISCSQDKQKQEQYARVARAMKSFCCIDIDVHEKELHNTCEMKVQAIQQLAKELAEKHGASLFDVGQQMVKQAASWSGSVQVLATRTLQNDSSYSIATPLSGLSGGEIQILMTLCAIHLSGADTVILDEPEHSLHPPQQAQMRRWIETQRPQDQVCVVVSHSTQFISDKSLSCLYHMSFVDESRGFTSFRLSDDSTVTDKKAETSAPMGGGGQGSGPSDDSTVTGKKAESSQVTLSKEIVTMLMQPDMRKMFFATGLYLVEGKTDKRVLSALRYYMMEEAKKTMEESKDLHDLQRAHKVLEMDQWDMLAINGCAEAVKAYHAAKDLKIPCAVVLDFDVISYNKNKRLMPFNSYNCKKSMLYQKLGLKKDSLPDAKTVLEEVDKALGEGTPPQGTSWDDFEDKELLKNTLKVFEEHGFWIWEGGDLETTICDTSGARSELLKIKDLFEAIDKSVPPTPDKDFWTDLKKKLHKGGWDRIPWETLLQVVEVCLQTKPSTQTEPSPKNDSSTQTEANPQTEPSPLANFCRFMKRRQCKGQKRKKELPPDLLSRILPSDEDDDY